jgi:hypothetical protein
MVGGNMKRFQSQFYIPCLALICALILTSIWFLGNDSEPQVLYAQISNTGTNSYVPTPCPLFNDSQPSQNENEEYAVYAAILAHRGLNAKAMVVSDHTISGLIENVPKIKPFTSVPLSEDTIKDYLSKVRQNQKLENNFVVCGKVALITGIEIEQFVKGAKGWSGFRRKYPEAWGIIVFSRVGFDKERKQALLGVKTICGEKCGEGTFWFVEKKNNKWNVERQILIHFS